MLTKDNHCGIKWTATVATLHKYGKDFEEALKYATYALNTHAIDGTSTRYTMPGSEAGAAMAGPPERFVQMACVGDIGGPPKRLRIRHYLGWCTAGSDPGCSSL